MSTLRERAKREQDILKQIALLDAKADRCISRIQTQPIEETEVHQILQEYIHYKFSVDSADFAQTENIIALAKISFRKTMAKGMIFYDQKNCHGVSESMDKKVLLITSIEQKLGFAFSMEEYIQIDTIADLAHMMMPHICAQRTET